MKKLLAFLKILLLYIFLFILAEILRQAIIYFIVPVRHPFFSLRSSLFPFRGLISGIFAMVFLLFLTKKNTKIDIYNYFKKIDPIILLITIGAAIILNLIFTFEKVFLTGTILNLPDTKEILFTGRIISPFLEEIFFRGFMLASFYKTTNNFVLSAILSSLLFSLVHFNIMDPYLPILISTFALGLITCYLMIKYKNLWYCIAFHFTYNFMVWITLTGIN